MIPKPITKGFLAALFLLIIYFSAVSLISGWHFALEQFSQFWYYIVALALGFGIQVGLYVYLKYTIRERASRGVMAVTGTTSTVSMLSCCAHYLINLLPMLGIAGALTIISQYQIQLFRVGLAFNAFGIIYIANKIFDFKKHSWIQEMF